MARDPEKPQGVDAAEGDEDAFAQIRRAMAEGEPALPYNEAAKLRIGKIITDAVLPDCVRQPVRHVSAKPRIP